MIEYEDIDDLEWPWISKVGRFSVLLRFSAAVHTSRVNCDEMAEIDQDNLRTGTAKAVARFMSFAEITCFT